MGGSDREAGVDEELNGARPLSGAGATGSSHVAALTARCYDELRRIAATAMRGERRGHTLRPTALVAEAFIALDRQRSLGDASREQFLAAAAAVMRRILVDHARRRARGKRGGGWARLSLEAADDSAIGHGVDVLALDEALGRLARFSPRQAQIVEARFFAGASMTEIASAAGLARQTIQEEWSFARAWLARELGDDERQSRTPAP